MKYRFSRRTRTQKYSDWVYYWAKDFMGVPTVRASIIDPVMPQLVNSFLPFSIDSRYPEDYEQELYDALTPDERLEYGAYEDDSDYIFDLIDTGDDIPGLREERGE
jgi:hypothetical protein